MDEKTAAEVLDPPRAWLVNLFASEQALKGGVVRRDKKVFLKNCTIEALQDAVYDRCFHLIETDDQFIVICNNAPIKIYC